MSTALDILLHKLEKTLHEVESRINQGHNSVVLPGVIIKDYTRFQYCLACFHCRLQCAALKCSRDVDPYHDFWLGSELLKGDFGENSDKAAFEIARTGNEEGLRKVLRSLAQSMTKKYADQQIGTLVSYYWSCRTPQELLGDTDEYLRKYGHLLPWELTEGSAARIRGNFPKVLKQHPYMMRRMRQIGR